MGQTAHDHFVTKYEFFGVGVTLFSKAFIGEVFGQHHFTIKDQVRMLDTRCCAPINLSF